MKRSIKNYCVQTKEVEGGWVFEFFPKRADGSEGGKITTLKPFSSEQEAFNKGLEVFEQFESLGLLESEPPSMPRTMSEARALIMQISAQKTRYIQR